MAPLNTDAARGRSLFLDKGIGETRGVVQLRGRPERLLIERPGEPAVQQLGAKVSARVRKVDRGLHMAFLDLGEGPDGTVGLSKDKPLVEGAWLEVEITAESRAGKGPVVRVLGPGEGSAARLLAAAPMLEERLKAFAPRATIVRGPDAREAADEAEAEALEIEHALPDGGSLSIEPTRALVAIDVDVGQRSGADAKRVSRTTNVTAIAEAARLLRLKALAGVVVIDLAGRGHDGEVIGRALREAFHPDQPGVSVGPISRFGTVELVKPWRERPLFERLCDAAGRPSALTVALRAARAIEREGRSASGARITLRASPEVVEALAPLQAGLSERLGPRITVASAEGFGREAFEVSSS